MGELEKKEQEQMEYMEEILTELLADDTWEFPKEARFFLLPGGELDILYL